MLEKQSGMPTEEGFYFITTESKNYWVAIVRVYGKAPFMKVKLVTRTAKTDDVEILDENGFLYNPGLYIFSQLLDYKNEKSDITINSGDSGKTETIESIISLIRVEYPELRYHQVLHSLEIIQSTIINDELVIIDDFDADDVELLKRIRNSDLYKKVIKKINSQKK